MRIKHQGVYGGQATPSSLLLNSSSLCICFSYASTFLSLGGTAHMALVFIPLVFLDLSPDSHLSDPSLLWVTAFPSPSDDWLWNGLADDPCLSAYRLTALFSSASGNVKPNLFFLISKPLSVLSDSGLELCFYQPSVSPWIRWRVSAGQPRVAPVVRVLQNSSQGCSSRSHAALTCTHLAHSVLSLGRSHLTG